MHPPIAAYRATTYRCYTTSGVIDIRVDRTHPELDRLLQGMTVPSWSFITAYNPRSQRISQAENDRRQAQLRDVIASRGWTMFQGAGIGDDGRWPAEPSFLVLGIARDEAIALGRQFEQAAIVFGEAGGRAELLLCDPPTLDPSLP